MKKRYLIIILILIIEIIIAVISKRSKSIKENIKIPILLYNDFVTTVNDSNPDNFNYHTRNIDGYRFTDGDFS